jgi:anaerobic glycerol-3-phosphate dehydrogenase
MRECDVLVIGGGVAGAAAALAAAGTGASVVLVRRGPGTTALAAGAWTGEPPEPLRDALATRGLALLPVAAPLAHADGRVLPCDWAPASHAAASPAAGDGVSLVCGIDGFPWFRPDALHRLWSAAAPGWQLASGSIRLDATPPAGWSPPSLAALLEREPARIAAPLRQALDRHGAARAILPAVLGLHEHARVAAELAEAGITAAEAPGGSPSIPGWRLDGALTRALLAAGVALLTGSARAAPTAPAGPRIFRVEGRDAGAVHARAVVLATGGFIGAGLQARPVLEEAATGLPVYATVAGRPLQSAADALLLTAPDFRQPQPLLEVGVEAAAAAAAGIHVAGAVRAGVAAHEPGLGHAAADGWNAGLAAATAAAG